MSVRRIAALFSQETQGKLEKPHPEWMRLHKVKFRAVVDSFLLNEHQFSGHTFLSNRAAVGQVIAF